MVISLVDQELSNDGSIFGLRALVWKLGFHPLSSYVGTFDGFIGIIGYKGYHTYMERILGTPGGYELHFDTKIRSIPCQVANICVMR